jgi:hypothetical protein
MRKIGLLMSLALLSFSLQAEPLRVKTATVKGTKPEITNNVTVFNHSEKGRTPKVGDMLRHYTITHQDVDGDGYTMALQWLRDGVPIPGATGDGKNILAAEYNPTSADIGKKLSVRVTISSSPSTTDPWQGDTKYSNELEPVTAN